MLPEMGALLKYGSPPADGVKLNGEALPRSKQNEANRELGDWECHVPGNPIIIRLPTRQVTNSDPVQTIDVSFAPA